MREFPLVMYHASFNLAFCILKELNFSQINSKNKI